MEANGSPPPEFEFDDDHSYFMCRLPVHPRVSMPEGLDDAADKATGKRVGKKVSKNAGGNAGKTKDVVLALLTENPRLSLAEIAETLNKATSTVERAAARLCADGRLRHVVPRKGGHWEVQP